MADESSTIDVLTDPAEMARALPWLLRGLPADEQASHLQTFAALLQSAVPTANLVVLAAYQAGERRGVALAQILAGRTALVWPPYDGGDPDLSQLLFRRLHEELADRQVVVAQALVPPKLKQDRVAFERAGFIRAGELVYMIAELDTALPLPEASEISFRPADPADSRLAETIEASYHGSLDCPVVDGWRSIPDVLEGYRSLGTFRPELWQFGYVSDKIVGCLLMCEYPEQQQGEVVYLGIRPEYRGRGWGRLFARQALRTGHVRRWRQALLAVDEANDPAYRMYRDAGFQDLIRREVFVRRM